MPASRKAPPAAGCGPPFAFPSAAYLSLGRGGAPRGRAVSAGGCIGRRGPLSSCILAWPSAPDRARRWMSWHRMSWHRAILLSRRSIRLPMKKRLATQDWGYPPQARITIEGPRILPPRNEPLRRACCGRLRGAPRDERIPRRNCNRRSFQEDLPVPAAVLISRDGDVSPSVPHPTLPVFDVCG